MKKLGLTGNIGAGKSEVARLLRHMGYPVYDSDDAAKQLYATNPELKQALIALFGEAIYADSSFQRQEMAKQLFENPALRQHVNALVHPLVRQDFSNWAHQQTSALVFNEAAILFETQATDAFDAMVLVCAPEALRIERVMARDACSREEVQKRIAAQWPEEKKREIADFCIENDGRSLLIQVEALIENLLR
jgi:dephospho-CoA kinase